MTAPTITLTQKAIYRSITRLPQTTLPNLTVLTGVNGSGKSHLLEAISQGQIAVDVAPDPRKDVRLVTWASLVPQDVGITNVVQINAHRDYFISQVRNFKSQLHSNVLAIVSKYELTQFASDPWRLFTVSEKECKTLLGDDDDRISSFRSDLKSLESKINAHIANQTNNQDEIKKVILRDLSNKGMRFVNLTRKSYDDATGGYYGLDIFQHSFGDIFFSYFEKVKDNRLRKIDEEEGRPSDEPSLSDEEFVAKFGGPPWDFVNDTLKVAKLDFRIDRPIEYAATEYVPKLTKVSTNTDVSFSSLSSGEKVLMSFAFCLYNSSDRRQNITRPKLLLLDEVDAPLHPSMSKVLLDIIKEMLIEKEKIPVILVTHSPSTVAVSPDESIRLLEPITNHILTESKRRAVSSLTAEIPTMSIDFSGRRQVFVEDDLDAERYGLLYQIFAPQIESKRSLAFIGIGRSDAGITGSDQVKTIVAALSAAGNSSVMGLIDWDTTNRSGDRVLVLGEGDRYAIENYLLDPLLIAAAALNNRPEAGVELSLPSRATFASFSQLSDFDLQQVSFTVQRRILSTLGMSGEGELVNCAYLSGKVISVDRRYVHVNGHTLEDSVLETFPNLRRYHHRTGDLLKHMINMVIRNHPYLAPKQLLDAMVWLCSQEVGA
ncbi:AAA family ATPase [Mesorhizobium sp.]|uniref:AAA family ATPase n=1 Tax=Mesorhizobium sp. TaxID=1871066 RepID=UPI0025CCB6AE|nr:AAA family ATPase [Mesorhizobium sp.]